MQSIILHVPETPLIFIRLMKTRCCGEAVETNTDSWVRAYRILQFTMTNFIVERDYLLSVPMSFILMKENLKALAVCFDNIFCNTSFGEALIHGLLFYVMMSIRLAHFKLTD